MVTKAVRFNKTSLTSFVQEGACITLKDTVVSGLKFKVGKRRSVFQFEKRISGHKGAPITITITIGAFPAIPVDQARQEAYRLARLCEQGIDPRIQSSENQEIEIPLREALDLFFEAKKEIGKITQKWYRDTVKCHFPQCWMDTDIRSITSEMVVKQFHVVRAKGKKVCWDFLELVNNLWNTCMPLLKDSKQQLLLKVNPVQEARIMLKNIKRPEPYRLVIPLNILGKFVVTLEHLGCSSTHAYGVRLMSRAALVCLFTAFRFHKAKHLKWDYVDLEQGIIRLPGQMQSESDGFEGTKNRHDHFVPLSSYIWYLLRELSQDRDNLSSYVFPSIQNPSKPMYRNCEA